ncbi:MAG: hypothetical protein CMJ76_11520 [Planctomycetaceae bacterium]|nr:hypothetical protein [Planctomycetaceae bacterium]
MNWNAVEVDLRDNECSQDRSLIGELSRGDIPATIFRRAIGRADCEAIMERLVERELLFDAKKDVPLRFREESIPEGHYREGKSDKSLQAWRNDSNGERKIRIDIGSSLGYRGSDRESFLKHSAESNQLFDNLFDGLIDPIEVLYKGLQKIAPDKKVCTAKEADGRLYGKAIIRAHYGGYSYAPHFDSVRRREKRTDYQAYRFEHQLAGVLVLQNTVLDGISAQCRIHQCFWEPEVQPYLSDNNFYEYADKNQIPNADIVLEPGDLYFFNTGCIHEVPGVDGEAARVVVATFIGYSDEDPEVFVWS